MTAGGRPPDLAPVRPGRSERVRGARTTGRSDQWFNHKPWERRAGMSHLTYPEAGVVGLIQGITELFPVSSLGHAILIPAIVGGQWAQDLSRPTPGSPFLAFNVGLHVATATAIINYFRRGWLRNIRAFFASGRHVL